MPIAPLLVQGAGFLASMALWEGVSALFENYKDSEGNTSEAVAQALESASRSATSNALWEQNKPARMQEALGKQFSGINPGASLSELALLRQGAFDRSDPDKFPTLNFVTNKLGMRPEEFVQRTSPTRMGDFTGIQMGLPPMMREKNSNAQ